MSYIQIVGAGGGGAGSAAAIAISGNTSGALATITSGTAVFFGGNNITLSQNAQSITVSGGVGGGTLSMWEPIPSGGQLLLTRQLGQSSLFVYPLYIPANLSVTQWMNIISVTVSTSSNSSFAAALSESVGIYTITGSTLNLLTASSGATNVVFSNTSNNSTASLNGVKGFTVPLTMNATPGNYWIGVISATATTNSNGVSISNAVLTQANSIYSGQLGQVAAATQGIVKGAGMYSVQTAALPATIGLAELTASNILTIQNQYMIFNG